MASSSMASSSKRPRSLTSEDDEEKEEESHRKKCEFDLNKEPEPEDDEEDDSDETLGLLRRLEMPAIPPGKVIHPGLIGLCSKPIRKQLTKKDVNVEEDQEQSKLGLSKSKLTKEFALFIGGKEWIVVSVYGPDGKIHEMKMWIDEKNNKIDLKKGWSKFVGHYELKEISDLITVWMFWHQDRREICLAIDTIRLVLRKQVSKRISKAVFDDSD